MPPPFVSGVLLSLGPGTREMLFYFNCPGAKGARRAFNYSTTFFARCSQRNSFYRRLSLSLSLSFSAWRASFVRDRANVFFYAKVHRVIGIVD